MYLNSWLFQSWYKCSTTFKTTKLLNVSSCGRVNEIICFIYLWHGLIVDVLAVIRWFEELRYLSTSYTVEVWMSVFANPLNHKLLESVKSSFRWSLMFIGYSEVNANGVSALQEARRGNNQIAWCRLWKNILTDRYVTGESVRFKGPNGPCQRKL